MRFTKSFFNLCQKLFVSLFLILDYQKEEDSLMKVEDVKQELNNMDLNCTNKYLDSFKNEDDKNSLNLDVKTGILKLIIFKKIVCEIYNK